MRPTPAPATQALVILLAVPVTFGGSPAEMHAAVRSGDVMRVADLLAAAPELVQARTADGETPLHAAVAGRQQLIVEMLLASGADPNAADAAGRTPLHAAALTNDAALLKLLIAAGADVNAADRQGETPLHLAARRYRTQTLPALLAAGADANARNVDGQTPLHVLGAALRERDAQSEALLADLAEVLIRYGADPRIVADGLPALRTGEPADDRAGYHTYEQVGQFLQERAAAYPDLCRLTTVGTSVLGRDLWALNIGDHPGLEEDEPEFRYIAGIHGDEWTGLELCLNFIDLLLTGYGTDPRLTTLVDEVDLWVLPIMNPDGFVAVTRENAHGVDLNRNFPEGTTGDPDTTTGREPETAAVMEWTFASSFAASASYHGGALVMNYPYDNDGIGSVFSPTSEQDWFVWMSEEYSRHNPPMWASPVFYHGITNGADWYSITGGLQDWAYRYHGENDITLEVSNAKIPPVSQLPQFWEENRESMLAFVETVLVGVRGLVTDAATGVPLAATVTVATRDHAVHTDPDVGDYHRALLPGSYVLTFAAAGHDSLTRPVTAAEGPATRLEVALGPPTQVLYPNGGEALPAGETISIAWQGAPGARYHVQYTANAGQSSAVSDSFESGLDAGYGTGGAAGWFITTQTAHSGTHSARAGTIPHGQQSWLVRPVLGGPVSFWYYVSSQSGSDFFNFYIDGVRKVHKSGAASWTYFSATLPAGTHTLRWEYVKDTSGSSGGDTALIDDVAFTADLTAWDVVVALTPPGATTCDWLPPGPGESYAVRVRAEHDAGGYGDWDASDAPFAVTEAFAAGDLNCDGAVDVFDIDPFVLALVDPAAYAALYPDCDILLGDVSGDGRVDAFDIDGFVALLTVP